MSSSETSRKREVEAMFHRSIYGTCVANQIARLRDGHWGMLNWIKLPASHRYPTSQTADGKPVRQTEEQALGLM